MASKKADFKPASEVAKEVDRLLSVSEKTQQQISDEMNLQNSNVLTMFKKGRTKLPIKQVVPLCKALGVEPRKLMNLVLEENHPDLFGVLEQVYGLNDAIQIYIDVIAGAKQSKEEAYRKKVSPYSSPGQDGPPGKLHYDTTKDSLEMLEICAYEYLILDH